MSKIGSIIWIMLHTFAAKIKEEIYTEHKETIITLIKEIFSNYPCKICQIESLKFLELNKESLNAKKDLELFLFNFHTKINIKLSKTYFSLDRLKCYEKSDINKIYLIFVSRCQMPSNINTFLTSHTNWFEV